MFLSIKFKNQFPNIKKVFFLQKKKLLLIKT